MVAWRVIVKLCTMATSLRVYCKSGSFECFSQNVSRLLGLEVRWEVALSWALRSSRRVALERTGPHS